jgi:triacylglycerol lipase
MRKSFTTLVAIALMVCILDHLKQGCQGAEFRVIKDLRYGNTRDESGLCDVYLPVTIPAAGHPVVLVVHGGAWISGDKWTIAGYARELAANGFAAVAINYRLAPQHKFPKQVDDVRQALVWTHENAEPYSFDLSRVGLFGYSAGGHLVTLVSGLADEPMSTQISASLWTKSDERWSRIPRIIAVCAGGPPCDFRSLPPKNTSLAYFLGGSRADNPAAYVAASPTAHVSAKDPVTQIIHGEKDMLVPIANSQSFHEAQKEKGVDSRMKTLPNQGHMVTFMNPTTSKTMIEFFRQVLVAESKPE